MNYYTKNAGTNPAHSLIIYEIKNYLRIGFSGTELQSA
jgi:hypothetical protein